MKFAFYTDFHLRATVPEKRIDDFPEALLSKLKFIYRTAKESGCECVVFGGDFFDKHNLHNHEIVVKAGQILQGSGITTYQILGQHDLSGYNKDSYGKSSLCLYESFLSNFKTINTKIDFDDCVIYACNVFDDLKAMLASPVSESKLKILIAHHLITNEKTIFETHNTKDLPCNYELVLSGDLHSGFNTHSTTHEGKSTVWANPGSVARLSISDYNRKPSMFVIDTAKYSTEDLSFINRIQIPCGSAADVFSEKLEGAAVIERYDNDRFVDSIKTFETEAIDIYDLLEKIGKSDNVDNEVLSYILSKKN